MEKNPYTMAKLGLENNALLRPQRDCGFYAKYIFLFLSLIQFLIILGLVLFMVYGNNQAATEQHLQAMSSWLQECRDQTGALTKEKANLTTLLNASRAESRQLTGQLNRFNATTRICSAEKVKLQTQLQAQIRQADTTIQSCREWYEMASYCNATYPDKVKVLEAQLKVQALTADLEKKKVAQENQRLQSQAKKAEQEEEACQRDVLQLRTQVRKAGELESQVTRELEAASQSVRAAVEKALSSHTFWSCNAEEVRNLRTTCLNLSQHLDAYMATLSQRLESSIHAVAQENGALQKEKAACARDRREVSEKLAAQEQRAAQEQEALQRDCSAEKEKLYTEQQQLLGEKARLRQELDHTKQKCWANPAMRMPSASGGTNPFANLPGNFNPIVSMGSPWARSGGFPALPSAVGDQGSQGNLPALRNYALPGNLGSHRTSSRSGYDKLEDGRKPTGAEAIAPHQPLQKPAGQPSG